MRNVSSSVIVAVVILAAIATPVLADATSDMQAFNTHLKQWEVARAIIQHEDGLISSRISAYLTLQGLLFTALGFVVKAYSDRCSQSGDSND